MTTIDPRFAPIVERVRSDEQAAAEARAAARAAREAEKEAEREAARIQRIEKARTAFEERFIAAVTEQQSIRKWSTDTFVEAVSYASAMIMTDQETEIPEVTSQVAEVIHRAFAFSLILTPNFLDVDYYVGQRESWYPEWQKTAITWNKNHGTKKSAQPTTVLLHSTSTGDQPSEGTEEGSENVVDEEHLTTTLGDVMPPQLKVAFTASPKKAGSSRKTGHSSSGKLAAKRTTKKSVSA